VPLRGEHCRGREGGRREGARRGPGGGEVVRSESTLTMEPRDRERPLRAAEGWRMAERGGAREEDLAGALAVVSTDGSVMRVTRRGAVEAARGGTPVALEEGGIIGGMPGGLERGSERGGRAGPRDLRKLTCRHFREEAGRVDEGPRPEPGSMRKGNAAAGAVVGAMSFATHVAAPRAGKPDGSGADKAGRLMVILSRGRGRLR